MRQIDAPCATVTFARPDGAGWRQAKADDGVWGKQMVNQNIGRGLLLGAIALLFLVQAPHYKIGTLSRPGPGLFPVIVASILLFIGVVIVARSYFIEAVPFDF